MIGSELRRYAINQKYNCADLETEGLNLFFSRPWQVTWTLFNIKQNLSESTRYIWWPDLKVSKRAAIVTRFDFNAYKQAAEDPKKVLEEFEDKVHDSNYDLVSHNWLGYDCMILNAWRRGVGLKPRNDYYTKVFDTLAMARAYKENITPDVSSFEAFLAFQYRMLNYRYPKCPKTSLGVISKDLGIKVDSDKLHDSSAVSYTHLTLPTNREV